MNTPVCYARDSDPAYMGYLSRDELIVFLNEMLEAERAGARVTLRSARQSSDAATKILMEAVYRDEAKWCALLFQMLRGLGAKPSARTGAFHDKAMAIADMGERLDFLNRGQGWVVRKLREALPKVRDDELHGHLHAMLVAHQENIQKVASFQGAA